MTRKHLQPNYYDILGVDRSASTDDIKAAYRKLDRYHAKSKGKARLPNAKDAEILRINAAYALLSYSTSRIKYDIEMFGVSAALDSERTRSHWVWQVQTIELGGRARDVWRAESVRTLHDGAVLSTAIAHRTGGNRSKATNFMERKQFRAAKAQLPTQSASMAWLAFPVVLVALWGVSLKSIRNQSKKYGRV